MQVWTDDDVIDLIEKALEMTYSLKRIGQYYFNEAEYRSPYISSLIEIDYEFNDGCDHMIKILNALKNQLQFNHCMCNKFDTC